MADYLIIQDANAQIDGRGREFRSSDIINDTNFNITRLKEAGVAVIPYTPGTMAPAVNAFRDAVKNSQVKDMVSVLASFGIPAVDPTVLGLILRFRTINADHIVLAEDVVIIADASSNPVTVNLCAASFQPGKILAVIAKDLSNAITIQPCGGETISGSASYGFQSQWDALLIISDGNDWFIF